MDVSFRRWMLPGVTSSFCSCLAPSGRERNLNDLSSAWDGSASSRKVFWEAVMWPRWEIVWPERGRGLPGKERAWIHRIYRAESREVCFTGTSEALWINWHEAQRSVRKETEESGRCCLSCGVNYAVNQQTGAGLWRLNPPSGKGDLISLRSGIRRIINYPWTLVRTFHLQIWTVWEGKHMEDTRTSIRRLE